MSDILISLERILPNPWQVRQPHVGDDGHVAALAADIHERGLLQPPMGRLVDENGIPWTLPEEADYLPTFLDEVDGWLVQLAFGHHRLAAFRALAIAHPTIYRTMPVRIATLEDQDMALAAWAENAARKDLTPLEQARAIERLMADFNWTQVEVAEKLQLARPTVSNKLRLLKLPAELLDKLTAGELSERQALALLPVLELPDAAQERLAEMRKSQPYNVYEYAQVAEHPERVSSEQIRKGVDRAIAVVTKPLAGDTNDRGDAANFPTDEPIAGVDAPACRDCPQRLRETRCADPACYARKQAEWERQQCAFAVQATGISCLSRGDFSAADYNHRSHFGTYDQGGLDQARAQHCPNLRLVYYGAPVDGGNNYPVRVQDYAHVAYACIREKGPCTCVEGPRHEREKAEHAAQKARQKEARKVREAAVRDLTAALERQELPALRAVLAHVVRYSGHPDQVAQIPDAGTVREKIAREVLGNVVSTMSVEQAEQSLARWRKQVGFEEVVSPDRSGEAAQEK